MADLDGTMLHYLAVRKAIVSVHRPIHSKIMLTYSLTWQTDHCSPQRMALRALLNTKAWQTDRCSPRRMALRALLNTKARQTDRCSPRRMALRALLNAKAALSLALLKFSLHLLFEKLQKRAPTKTQLRVLSIIDPTKYVRGHIDNPPTLN